MSNADPVPTLQTSERIYRMLLRAYPADYRRQYGPLMAQAFRDLSREVAHRRSLGNLANFWVRTLADVATTAAVERVDVLLNGPPPDITPPSVEMVNVYKGYQTKKGHARLALYEIDLTIRPSAFVAVVGPTGSGKSTLLSLIAGLEKPSRGEVKVAGKPVHDVSQRIGLIFQSDALFPWKTVLHNVLAGPLFRGIPKAEALEQAQEWIRRVGLTGFENYYPYQLSGGMRKRVALAQSLIIQPDVLLMDEPFSDLDVQSRALMEEELLDLWASTEASVAFVTHDLEEAIALADEVIVLTAGPATIKGRYTVDLPRPRRISELRFNRRFIDLHREIWASLRAEVTQTYERSKLTLINPL